MEQTFDTLCDAISYAFRREETSMLSLDRICQVLESPNLYINSKSNGPQPCSSVTRRRISSTLSSSELFVRAGPPRACLWAIRPHNPLFLSDSAISASIENMLTTYGPMTVQQFVQSTDLSGASVHLFERVLTDHEQEFSCGPDQTWWFANQERPQRNDFENISQALVTAFRKFPNGASVEELHWNLCLSTVGGTKPITRRCISRELSRRSDLFKHLSRARYGLIDIPSMQVTQPLYNSLPIELARKQTLTPVLPQRVQNFNHPDNFCSFQQPMPEPSVGGPISFNIDDPLNGMSDLSSFVFPNDAHDFSSSKDPNDDTFDPANFFNTDVRFSFDA